MCDIQSLDYNGQRIRTTLINGEHWWSLSDMGAVIGMKKIYGFSSKLADNEKKIIVVKNPNKRGCSRLVFVNNSTLYKFLNRSYRPQAVDVQNWIESNFDVKFPDIPPSSISKSGASIQASLQKVQMLIRIAENKSVPYEEQVRLLGIAVQILTGEGFKTKKMQGADAKKPVEESVQVDIKDLPEVIGFVQKKATKFIEGCPVNFFPAKIMSDQWKASGHKFDENDFSKLADDFNLKNDNFGYWQRVMTPQGEAREFMYIEGTIADYMRKVHNLRKAQE